MGIADIRPSPCTACEKAPACKRSADPDNKTSCKEWDAWFRENWAAIQATYKIQINQNTERTENNV